MLRSKPFVILNTIPA